jgi:hypothetical protein
VAPALHPLRYAAHLVQLEADEAGNEAGGGGDGRDDAAGNALDLQSVRRGDRIVGRAQIGRRSHKVNVEVGVVVLGTQAEAGVRSLDNWARHHNAHMDAHASAIPRMATHRRAGAPWEWARVWRMADLFKLDGVQAEADEVARLGQGIGHLLQLGRIYMDPHV